MNTTTTEERETPGYVHHSHGSVINQGVETGCDEMSSHVAGCLGFQVRERRGILDQVSE